MSNAPLLNCNRAINGLDDQDGITFAYNTDQAVNPSLRCHNRKLADNFPVAGGCIKLHAWFAEQRNLHATVKRCQPVHAAGSHLSSKVDVAVAGVNFELSFHIFERNPPVECPKFAGILDIHHFDATIAGAQVNIRICWKGYCNLGPSANAKYGPYPGLHSYGVAFLNNAILDIIRSSDGRLYIYCTFIPSNDVDLAVVIAHHNFWCGADAESIIASFRFAGESRNACYYSNKKKQHGQGAKQPHMRSPIIHNPPPH